MNVVNLIVQTADRLPEKTALVFRNEPMSYQELKEKILRVANGLKSLGIREDMNVGLMLTTRPEYVLSYFALLAIGATVVPLNPQYKEKELTYALNDSESQALIYDQAVAGIVENAKNHFTTTNLLIPCYGKEDPRCEWTKLLDSEPLDELTPRISEDTAQIIYTSGTTGNPKGAMITHDNVAWMTKAMTDEQGTNEKDRVIVVLPLFHAFAKMAGIWCPLYKGATIYIEERFHPDAILEMIERERITVFSGVPTMFTLFVHSPRLKEFDYSSLRIFGSGGASIPVEIIDRIKKEIGVEMVEAYGQTEATIMITSQPVNGEKVVGSVGPPIEGVDLRIVTPDDRDVPQGEIGEIIFRGRNAMKGYYNKPEETATTIRDGWVYTGDLAYQDKNGNVFIVDRKKDMIIRGGYNVYPREIEEVLYAHSDVIECAVVGEAHEILGEEIVAYVVVKNNLQEEELSAYCREHLAKYKTPRVFRFLDSLPKTVTGKILKGPLRKKETKTI
ncbi:class I adenylate-forming enzyme family protein [Cytobacillus sp. FJAT-54145]|uniref:Class I adenylate-forming enzyme family protein n=1 Tax=Cytobacillus spartinae TaxID=3299023 RepID=A0ABW6K659_9BACI